MHLAGAELNPGRLSKGSKDIVTQDFPRSARADALYQLVLEKAVQVSIVAVILQRWWVDAGRCVG